jgi:hypothetical protein
MATIKQRLVDAGVLDGTGDVDTEYYAIQLAATREDIEKGLSELAEEGRLVAVSFWRCPNCEAENEIGRSECFVCGSERTVEELDRYHYRRGVKRQTRDPAAVFLIHGMNTLGDWQQSLAWKIQLLYGYSVPQFVFKFGRDLTSPLLRHTQEARVRQLGFAVRSARADLRNAGRENRCDVVAHSFGTLLITGLLAAGEFQDLEFGRIILTSSIAPTGFQWSKHIRGGRVEAVLNHRAGLDVWVRRAPWFFPGVGASGAIGFSDTGDIEDFLSVGFGHSDYFLERNFENVIRETWGPFLNGRLIQRAPTATVLGKSGRWIAEARRFWVGRLLLAAVTLLLIPVLLRVLIAIGDLSEVVLRAVRF